MKRYIPALAAAVLAGSLLLSPAVARAEEGGRSYSYCESTVIINGVRQTSNDCGAVQDQMNRELARIRESIGQPVPSFVPAPVIVPEPVPAPESAQVEDVEGILSFIHQVLSLLIPGMWVR
jgi:hypothetical protein